MSKIDNNNTLLREQLGKGKNDIITTETATGKDYYCIHFPVDTVINDITMPNALIGTDALDGQTMFAGTVLMMRVTGIKLTSGIAICYIETDGDISA